MTTRLAEHGITWDEDGRPRGFQIGKAAAMLDYAHKREKREFEKLCEKLRARNWARKQRQLHPERVNGNTERWRRKNRDRYLALAREAQRKRADARGRPTCRCDQCGKTWTPQPKWKGKAAPTERRARWCSRRCANAYHGKRRTRSRGIRTMDVQALVLGILRASPCLTPKEIAAREPRLKACSVASLLSVWGKQGVLVERRRQGRAYVYRTKE